MRCADQLVHVVLQCMKNPVPIGVGYLAQYIIKPLLGFAIAKVRDFSSQLRHLSPAACFDSRCLYACADASMDHAHQVGHEHDKSSCKPPLKLGPA